MTSTPFNVGLADDTRRSSRVICPPGGRHTDIFGAEPEPPRYGRRQASQVLAAQQAEAAAGVTNGMKASTENSEPQVEAAPVESAVAETPQEVQHIEANEPVEPAPVITAPTPPAEAPKAEPPKRVRVPPGGFSSKLW